MASETKGPRPRPGYEGIRTGVPSGKYPGEPHLRPEQAAAGRPSTGSPVQKYPNEAGLVPEKRAASAAFDRAGDASRPDIPAPDKVPPVITNPSPRPNLSVPK